MAAESAPSMKIACFTGLTRHRRLPKTPDNRRPCPPAAWPFPFACPGIALSWPLRCRWRWPGGSCGSCCKRRRKARRLLPCRPGACRYGRWGRLRPCCGCCGCCAFAARAASSWMKTRSPCSTPGRRWWCLTPGSAPSTCCAARATSGCAWNTRAASCGCRTPCCPPARLSTSCAAACGTWPGSRGRARSCRPPIPSWKSKTTCPLPPPPRRPGARACCCG